MISSFRLSRLTIVMTVWVMLLLAAPRIEAAVSLSYFQAEADTGAGAIRLSWATETEVNVAAFRLMRNTMPILATAAQVDQQPSQGTNIGGASYTFVDRGVYRGTTYYYWLYELSNDGQLTLQRTSLMPQDYLSLTAPNSAAPAPTATSTPTPPASATLPTQQPAPTQTPVPTVPPTPVVQPAATQPPASSPTPDAPGAVSVDGPVATRTSTPASAGATPATGGPVLGVTETPISSPTLLPSPTPPPEAVPPTSAPTTSPVLGESDEQPAALPTLASGEAPAPATEQLSSPQAVAQAAASVTPAATGELLGALQSRPTATPRPVAASDTAARSNATDLLLVVGGGAVCGAALLALVALIVWRRR